MKHMHGMRPFVVVALTTTTLCAGLLALAPAAGATGKTPVYVALGDSYSSGEGTGKGPAAVAYDPATNNSTDQCHRSAKAYSQVETKIHSVPHIQTLFDACSGAKIVNFETLGQYREQAQLIPLIRLKGSSTQDVQYVSLTVGGNDANFAGIIENCVVDHLKRFLLFHTFCHGKDSSGHSPNFAAIQASLTALYSQVLTDAPDAQIYVLGYPKIFAATPYQGTCDVWAADAVTLNSDAHILDAAVQAAVAAANVRAGTNRITYVSVENAVSGHELCRQNMAGSYMNGFLFRAGTTPYYTESFHPNVAGQQMFANVLDNAVA